MKKMVGAKARNSSINISDARIDLPSDKLNVNAIFYNS